MTMVVDGGGTEGSGNNRPDPPPLPNRPDPPPLPKQQEEPDSVSVSDVSMAPDLDPMSLS